MVYPPQGVCKSSTIIATIIAFITSIIFGPEVYYSATNGFAGTAYPIGTKNKPVNNTANLRTILTAHPWIRTVIVLDTLSLAPGDSFPSICFRGIGAGSQGGDSIGITTITVGGLGAGMDNCIFEQANIAFTNFDVADVIVRDCGRVLFSSTAGGTIKLKNCNWVRFNTTTGGTVYGSDIGTLTLDSITALDITIIRCNNLLQNTVAGGAAVAIRVYDCDIATVAQSGAAGAVTTIDGVKGGLITLAAGCVAGIINISGLARTVDGSVGATVNNTSTSRTVGYRTDAAVIVVDVVSSLVSYIKGIINQVAAIITYVDNAETAIDSVETKLDGAMAVVPLFNTTQTTKAGSVTLFQIDALGGTRRNIKLNFYLALDAAATFALTITKTRPGDPLIFTQDEELNDDIVLPAANRNHSYDLGDLAEGLQMRVLLAQDNAGNANNACDAQLTYEA